MLFALLQLGGIVQISPEHPIESISMGAAIITFFYGIFILPLFSLVGGLPLLARPVRRSKVLLTLCIGVLCVPGLLLLNMGGWLLYLPTMTSITAMQRTHKLATPTMREGITLPAGSTVVDADVGSRSYTVQLAAPTMADGLLWTGELEVGAKELDAREGILSGTLAQPAVFQGIPCASGKATVAKHTANCVLSRDVEVRGYTLAGGHPVELSLDDAAAVESIERATSAKPLQIAGVTWPAGIRMAPQKATAADLRRPSQDPQTGFHSVCVEQGATALLNGATLRGPVEVRFSSDMTEVGNNCDSPDNAKIWYGSIRTPDGVVHRQGHIDRSTSAWTWTDENVPAKYVDGGFDPNE